MNLIRFILISLIVLNTTACQQDAIIDIRLEPYINDVQLEMPFMNVRQDMMGRPINFEIGLLNDGIMGVCRTTPTSKGITLTIIISLKHFTSELTENGIISVLAHEIGHCAFGLGHLDEVPIMRAGVSIYKINHTPYADTIKPLREYLEQNGGNF